MEQSLSKCFQGSSTGSICELLDMRTLGSHPVPALRQKLWGIHMHGRFWKSESRWGGPATTWSESSQALGWSGAGRIMWGQFHRVGRSDSP